MKGKAEIGQLRIISTGALITREMVEAVIREDEEIIVFNNNRCKKCGGVILPGDNHCPSGHLHTFN